MSGFGIRVFPSGRKTYLVQYRAQGRTRRRAIGQLGVLTADEARKEARKLLGEVAKGGKGHRKTAGLLVHYRSLGLAPRTLG